MEMITASQLIALNTVIYKKGLGEHKGDIVEGASGGRTRSTKDLYLNEAHELIKSLNDYKEARNRDDKGPMVRKLFAMAHEMGWITTKTLVAVDGIVTKKKDYSRVYDWVLKYGYLKKELRRYAYKELPKLLSQFEFHVYKEYISKPKK